MEDAKERRREGENETASTETNSSRRNNIEKPSILGYLVKTHNQVKNLMGKPRT